VAKTYVLQAADQPLAQGFLAVKPSGGRVDLEEKERIDNNLILPKNSLFLKRMEWGCG
jgi:hypothetical protein